MVTFVGWIIGLILGLGIGGLIERNLLSNCKHNYKLIKDGDIVNYNRRGQQMVVGFMKVYECEHCKKINSKKTYVN